MIQELTLLNPGPAGTSLRVRQAMLRGDLCHREPEFAELQERIRTALTRSLNLAHTHTALLLTGSGTAAMEMAVINSVRAGRKLLVVRNGVYGDRFVQIAAAHGVETAVIDESWTRPADPSLIRETLQRDSQIDAVACVHHETTTGLINPVGQIGEIVREHEAVFVVDAISSTAIEGPDLATVNADIICGTANKGLHGVPGVSFLLISVSKGVDRIASVPRRGYLLHAQAHLAAQQAGSTLFTPAVQACYALDEAIIEYEAAGGYSSRVRQYRERADTVRAGFVRNDLEILVDAPFRANSVTALRLPQGVAYPALHDEMKRRGYVIYAGLGTLAASHFRIATMGEIPTDRLVGIEPALGDSLWHLGRPTDAYHSPRQHPRQPAGPVPQTGREQVRQ